MTKHVDSYNPATDEVWAKIPDSSAEEVDTAVRAARDAFPKWGTAHFYFNFKY